MNAVDTNVFVYALDDNETVKQPKARALIDCLLQQPSETSLLWQVAGELLACLRKWESAGRITGADVEAHFQDVLAMFPICVPTSKVFRISFDLHSRVSLSTLGQHVVGSLQRSRRHHALFGRHGLRNRLRRLDHRESIRLSLRIMRQEQETLLSVPNPVPQLHRSGMEIDAAVESVVSLVETHHGPPWVWVRCLSPHRARKVTVFLKIPRWDKAPP